MKKYEQIRKVAEGIFEDQKSHNLNEIKEKCRDLDIDLESDKNAISNVVFKMKKEKRIRPTGEKGVYELMPLTEMENNKAEDSQEFMPEYPSKTKLENRGSRGKSLNLNWEDFFVLKPNTIRLQEMRVTITEKGEIRLNSLLHKNLPNKKIQIIFSKDYRTVLLNPEGEDAHIFTKAGTTKNRMLIEVFRKMKIKFPVGYIVNWDEKYEMWRGKLDITDKK